MAPKREAPPAGPPWDSPIHDAVFAFVDLEMSGLDVAKDNVLEVAITRARGPAADAPELDAFATLVRPPDGVVGATHVHGIDAAALEGAPAFADVAARVHALLEGAVFVAHAPAMDVAFLERELAGAGVPLKIGAVLDTLTLSRRAFALPSHALPSLCAALGIDAGRSHRAPDDVRAMRQVFARAVAALEPTTPRDLFHVRVGEGHPRPEIVAALRAACASGEPVLVRYRPSRRGPEEVVMRITDLLEDPTATAEPTPGSLGVDPVRVLGYLLPARSRRELRADRVLAVTPVGESPTRKLEP